MLNDKDILFIYEGTPGVPLVWIIGEDCLYDYPLSVEHSKMFLEHDKIIDISEQYADHEGITVRFMKNGEVLEELQTSEYFGSILLSNPLVLNLNDYAYGYYVQSPNAKFINNEFVITDGREMENLLAWQN
jgi:hypothetical protein